MPWPHWPDPVPGLVQVITPPCSVQPCWVSSALALLMLNGYGVPCLAFGLENHLLGGTTGTGLKFGDPYPCRALATSTGWLSVSCSACRM